MRYHTNDKTSSLAKDAHIKRISSATMSSKKEGMAVWKKIVLFLVASEGLFIAYEMLDALIQLNNFGLLK